MCMASSHDSYSENAESKTNLKVSVAYGASNDVDMPQGFFSGKIVEEDQSLERNTGLDQFMSHRPSHLVHRFPERHGDEQIGLECLGNNSLCTSGDRDTNIVVQERILDMEKKERECSNMSFSSFVKMNNNVFPAEAGDGNQCHEAGEDECILRRSNATVDASLLHNSSNLASVNTASSDKSQPPFSINDVSPESCLSFHSQDGSSLFLKGESMVVEEALNSQSQAEIRYPELDNVESSLASMTSGSSSECKSCTLTNHEVSAATKKINEFSSGNSRIDGLYQETRSSTDCEKPSDNGSKGSLLDDPFERDGSMLDATKGQGHQGQPATTVGEYSELDVALDDVKVCDICGDAGREYLLAICSRCSDGAEHIYCMREMLDKVPEANWLCEDCKIMEMENQNVDQCEGVSGRLKSTCLKEISQNSMSTLLLKQLPKLDTWRTDLDARWSIEELQSPHMSIRRQVGHLNEGKASELRAASSGTSSLRKSVFSHQISLKNHDVGKVKMADMAKSSQVQSAKGFEVFSPSKAYLSSSSFKGQPPLHSPRGQFTRSLSFNNSNNNPNVKTLIEMVTLKQNMTTEPTSNDLRKEGLVRSLTQSTFNNMNSECSNIIAASKKPSLLPTRIEDLGGVKEVKERNEVEKENLSAIGNSFIRPSATIASNYHVKGDAKSIRSNGKINFAAETSVCSLNKGFDDAVDLGSIEGKKLISYLSKSIGSSNGNFGAGNPKRSKVAKEDIGTSISAVDGSHSKNEIVSHHSVVQPLESGRKNDRMRDSTIFTSSRLSPLGGNRLVCCQRCSETGHTAQHCPIYKLRGSAHKPLAEQNSREVVKKGIKWRNAVDAAMSKSRVVNGEKSDILEELPAANADMICEAALKHPSASIQRSSPVQSNSSKESSEDSDVDPTKMLAATDSMQPPVLPLETSYKADCSSDNPSLTMLSVNPFAETLQVEAPPLTNRSTSAIPKLDCIWQGSFNVLGMGSPAEMFNGIQAHLSTSASYGVFQVASKVPAQVQLVEVSHISSWPLQFQGVDPQEENIALFFFAKDVESYEKSYKRLMDKMHRDDLALRGNINGTELLIFTSNKLPMNSKRWNRMCYLWGMFRGKRKYYLPVMSDQKPLVSNLNTELLNQDFSRPPTADVSNAQNLETSLTLKKISESTSCKRMSGQSTNNGDFPPKATDIEDKACRTLEASHIQSLFNQVACDPEVPQEQPSFPVGNSSGMTDEPLRIIGTLKLRLQMSTSKSCSEEKIIGTCQKTIDSDCTNRKACDSPVLVCDVDDESSLRRASAVPSVYPDCNQGAECRSIEVKIGDKETSPSVLAIIDDNPAGNLLEEDLLSCDSRTNRKPGRESCFVERLWQSSCEMSKNIVGTAQLVERPSWLPVEDEREQKKTCFSSSSSTITDDNVSSSKVNPLNSSILSQQQQGEGMCSVSVMPENSRSAEWCFFPMDLGPVQKNTSTNTIRMPSSDYKDGRDSSTLNLELALGRKSKTTKSVALRLPFHSVNGVREHMQHGTSRGGGDDASASLSLSLGCPAAERERSARGILKTEQVSPERPSTKAPAFLFGRFSNS